MRYWAYLNGEVPGSFSPEQLATVPGFTGTTLVCPAEGEIDEKSWRRAGEFEEIASALAARPEPAPLSAPAVAASAAASVAATAAAAPTPTDVDAMLDSASSKLFHHVADLMKELENRREERALVVSLQRQIAALKDELAQARDRAGADGLKLARLAELEESARKDQTAIESLRSGLQAREQAHNEARASLEKTKNELEATRRRQAEAYNDLAVRNRLVDKLSKDLTDKELSLAKSLGVIRRLEEDLNRLCPSPAALAAAPPLAPAAPPLEPPAVAAVPAAAPILTAAPAPPPVPVAAEPESVRELSVPAAPAPAAPEAPAAPLPTVTADEPPQAPPYLEPPHAADRGKPQQALAAFLKRFFPGQPH
jgi:hypothetical protein